MEKFLNAIPNVEVTPMNFFKLYELKINKELIAYIRFDGNKIRVFPHFNYAGIVGKSFYADIKQLRLSIENFKRKRCNIEYPCFN